MKGMKMSQSAFNEFDQRGQVLFKLFCWGTPTEHQGEDFMKSGNQDKVEGKLHEAKGKIKEVAGKITDNPKLEAEGKTEKIAGKVQGKLGEVKKVLED
jgi:uncharacterized protein YjbJ (UPF0337 family)